MDIEYELKDFCVINNAKIKLGDLTIIAGENNVGKTYFTYSLYGFLDRMNNKNFDKYSRQRLISNWQRERMENKHIPKGKKRFDIKKDLSENVIRDMLIKRLKHLTSVYSQTGSGLTEVFSLPDDIADMYPNRRFECTLPKDCISKLISSYNKEKIDDSEAYSNAYYIKTMLNNIGNKSFRIDVDFEIITDTARSYLRRSNQLKNMSEYVSESISKYMDELLFDFFIRKTFPKCHIMTSERFGVSLFYKELDFTKSRIVEILQKMATGEASNKSRNFPRDLAKISARYAQPISDNIDATRARAEITKLKSPLADDKLFNEIEQMMQGSFRVSSDETMFVSKKRKNRYIIPLHLASTSARAMVNPYFYLKHIVDKGQLLIIDEPEAHLDTKNQILMARLLARCVNAGVKVLITTHSDYMIQEFNNLIMLSSAFKNKEDDREKFLKKYKYDERCALKADSVKGYIFKDGSTFECETNDKGVKVSHFDKTINQINKISHELNYHMED